MKWRSWLNWATGTDQSGSHQGHPSLENLRGGSFDWPRKLESYQLSKLKFDHTDIRFTTKGDTLYAIALGWPMDGNILDPVPEPEFRAFSWANRQGGAARVKGSHPISTDEPRIGDRRSYSRAFCARGLISHHSGLVRATPQTGGDSKNAASIEARGAFSRAFPSQRLSI